MEHLPITQSFWMMSSAVETLNIATYSCVPGHKNMMYDGEENERSIGESDCTHLESNAMVYKFVNKVFV